MMKMNTGPLAVLPEEPIVAEEQLTLREGDVIHLILEYLELRKLTTSQLHLEKESGIVNQTLSPDLLFLRSLILDGRWDDVLEFLQPLEEAFRTFPGRKVRASILKHHFLDKFLAIYLNPLAALADEAKKTHLVEPLVKILKEFENVTESKEEYSTLCRLLNTPSHLDDHRVYKDWKSSTARLACFNELCPLIFKFIPPSTAKSSMKSNAIAKNDRLIQLLIKGLLYEACVSLSQTKATATSATSSPSSSKLVHAAANRPNFMINDVGSSLLQYAALLSNSQLSESDVSLFSWLRCIPAQTFNCPFQRRSLRVDVEPLPKVEKVLMNVSIMDSASDLLSRSMASTSFHLGHSTTTGTDNDGQNSTAQGQGQAAQSSSNNSKAARTANELKVMTSSVDKLFGDNLMSTDSFHKQTVTERTLHLPSLLNPKPEPPPPVAKPLLPPHIPTQATATPAPAQTTLMNISSTSSTKSSNNQSQSFEAKNNDGGEAGGPSSGTKFLPVTCLEDVQAVRCAEFHPSGRIYAVGSNSKTLRICSYPDLTKIAEGHTTYQPTVLFTRTKHHKGSIYCLGWSPDGNFVATGSNDKTVKLLRFDDVTNPELNGSHEVELSVHDGTVRDICFIEEVSNRTSLLVSGGAGDCKIYVTDCATSSPFQAMSGHTGPILSLYNWGGQIFCSGSQDKTVRFWDLRTRGCVDIITPLTTAGSTKSPVASVCVEPTGRLLISGHEDAGICFFDIRGQRQIQSCKIHGGDVRSVRFSPGAYYLLSGGYDNKLILTDLQGDLSLQLPSVEVANHMDKVISGRWHPAEFSFLSTSADKTVVLWTIPPDI